jgi:hypothetical protein
VDVDSDLKLIERAKLFTLVVCGLLVVFGLMDLSPQFYGPFEFMRDNSKFAPWFAGTATSVGVWVALLNGIKSNQMVRKRAEDDSRQVAVAACAIANMAHLNAAIVVSILLKEDWKAGIPSLKMLSDQSLSLMRASSARFPTHQLSAESIVIWYRIDLHVALLATNLEDLIKKNSDKVSDDRMMKSRSSILNTCRRTVEFSHRMADTLGVKVKWDFGTTGISDIIEATEPFEVPFSPAK